MATLLIVVVAICVLAVLVATASKRGSVTAEPDSSSYVRRGSLFTPAERSFLGVLDSAMAGEYRVFAKVRVADVVDTRRGLSGSEWRSAFNKITAKHFDFVLCDKDGLTVVCAIELDDGSHDRDDRVRRDEFIEETCTSIELPLIRVVARRAYTSSSVREEVLAKLGRPASKIEEVRNEPVALDSSSASESTRLREQSSPPTCPQCGAQMVRRRAKSGATPGKEFWGCTRFPACRGVL